MSKSTSKTTHPKEFHFPQTYISSKISVKQSSSIWSHQSPNSGHHCRQFSCIFLISIHCFRAWHKVETKQIFIEWNLPTYISHLLGLSIPFLPLSGQTLTDAWLADSCSINYDHICILHNFSSLFMTSFILQHIQSSYKVLHKVLVGGNKLLSLSKSHISVTLLCPQAPLKSSSSFLDKTRL